MSKVKVFFTGLKKKEEKYQSGIILRTTKQNMNYSNKEFEKNPNDSKKQLTKIFEKV